MYVHIIAKYIGIEKGEHTCIHWQYCMFCRILWGEILRVGNLTILEYL